MDLRQRFRIAIKEDANILGLASATALSLVLLNPLPLLVGLAVEVVYLLYITDSGWYNSRLSHRYDATIITRRQLLQAGIFPSLSEPIRERLESLESARKPLSSIKVEKAEEKRWLELLRHVDYHLEVLAQLFGRQVTIASQVAASDVADRSIPRESAVAEDYEWKTGLLEHYEHRAEELMQIANQQEYGEKQAILMRSVRELERGTETIRHELFQEVVAEHLEEGIAKLLEDSETLINTIPARLEGGTVESLDTEVNQLIQSAERFAQHQNDWLKQNMNEQTRIEK